MGPQAEADMMGGSVAVGGKTQPDSEPFKRSEVIRNLVEVNPALAQIVIRRLVELSAQHGVALFSNDDWLGDRRIKPRTPRARITDRRSRSDRAHEAGVQNSLTGDQIADRGFTS